MDLDNQQAPADQAENIAGANTAAANEATTTQPAASAETETVNVGTVETASAQDKPAPKRQPKAKAKDAADGVVYDDYDVEEVSAAAQKAFAPS